MFHKGGKSFAALFLCHQVYSSQKEIDLTFKECVQLANQYDTLCAFRKSKPEIAKSILKKWKWSVLHKKEKRNYSYEECLSESQKYKNRAQFFKNQPTMYKICKDNGWLNEIIPLETEKPLDEIIELAKTYKQRSDFRKSHQYYYFRLRDANLLQEIYGNSKKIVIDESYAINESKKYTSTDFKKKRWYLYKKCRENGWVDKLQFKEDLQTIKQTEILNKSEKIKIVTNIASTCSTKKEFREKHPKEYHLASYYKLLKNFTWLKGCKKEWEL